MIDVNVSLSRWPFRRLPLDDPRALASALRGLGVVRAWAGNFDALLHRDVAWANERLAADCRAHGDGLFLPFGTVDPTLSDWRDDVRRCHETHEMPGLRLHPNYHGYKLDDPRFADLLDEAAGRAMPVQVAVAMEDARTQHPLMRVPPVDLSPLPRLVEERPDLRVVLLNLPIPPRTGPVADLLATKRVWVDMAMIEGVAGIERFAAAFGADRLMSGSHAPFFCPDAVPLKLQESELTPADREAIVAGNASGLLWIP